MNRKWNEKTTVEKIADIIGVIALVAWLLLEFLGKKGLIAYSEITTCIAVGIVCICEAVSYWNVKRTFSYVAIGGLVLLTAVTVLLVL